MTLELVGRCTGCDDPKADLLVFNDYGQFCVDCDTKGIAYQMPSLTPVQPTTYKRTRGEIDPIEETEAALIAGVLDFGEDS